jgi:hypothetical protein
MEAIVSGGQSVVKKRQRSPRGAAAVGAGGVSHYSVGVIAGSKPRSTLVRDRSIRRHCSKC